MGLFGLFYTAFGLGARGYGSIKDKIEDERNKNLYYNKETNTYLDHNMTRRNVDNNHIMEVETAYNGDKWLRDVNTGKYVSNLSQNRAEQKYLEERERARRGQSQRTHIKYGEDNHINDRIPGYRYKDFKTGELYIARKFFLSQQEIKELKLHWYDDRKKPSIGILMDMDKNIIRLTDKGIEDLLIYGATSDEIEQFCPKFYERIKKTINEPYGDFDITDPVQRELDPQDSTNNGNFITEGNNRNLYKRQKRRI